jgi:hypothetical protein
MHNSLTWDRLKIEQPEIESILQCNLFDNLAIEMANLLISHQSKNKLSFVLTEATLVFLGTLFLVPINLLIGQKWLSYHNQFYGFAIVISLSLTLALTFLLALNLWLWRQAKKIKNIAAILQKIARYNHLIQNFQLLTKFNNLSTVDNDKKSQSNSDIVTTLQVTKDSLLKSLELENFILHNQQLQSQERYQLLNNLEDDLVQFMSLSNQKNTTEYQQLLAEAIAIGLSVHQELRQKISDR